MSKIYLTVNFDQKEEAKLLGAKWDQGKKRWFVTDNNSDNDKEAIKRFGKKQKKFFLHVPFEKKEEAKTKGAQWDAKKKKWYVCEGQTNRDLLVREYPIPKITLIGENRNFGGKSLYIDYIPKTCWFTNVRYCVAEEDWNLLRKHIYERAKNQCEVCGIYGGKSGANKLEAHERWSYMQGEQGNVQKLERLIALCRACHLATHYGFACNTGFQKQAYNQLLWVNGFQPEQLQGHLKFSQELYHSRSEVKWDLDLSLISNAGLKIVRPVNCDERDEIARILAEGDSSENEEN